MGRIIHFEIHVDDMERAKLFYGDVFGWTFEDWTAFTGTPYFGAITGDTSEPGINGALMQRQSAPPEVNQGLNAFVCTMGTEDRNKNTAKLYDALGLAEYEAIEAFKRFDY